MSHDEITARLREKAVQPKQMKSETARIQVMKTLQAIQRKLQIYSLQEDQRPEFQSIKLERIRRRGVRIVTSSQAAVSDSPRRFQEQVLSRLSQIERRLDELREKIDSALKR